MSEIENRNKKNIIFEDIDEYDDNNGYNEDEERVNEEKEEEYFNDSVRYIYNNVIGFVNDKSLPLCEYLKPISIQKFLEKHF
jgi:hypothetical protein